MSQVTHQTSTHLNNRHTLKRVEQPGSTPGAITKYVVPCTVGKSWDQYDWSMHGHQIEIGSGVVHGASCMCRANVCFECQPLSEVVRCGWVGPRVVYEFSGSCICHSLSSASNHVISSHVMPCIHSFICSTHAHPIRSMTSTSTGQTWEPML